MIRGDRVQVTSESTILMMLKVNGVQAALHFADNGHAELPFKTSSITGAMIAGGGMGTVFGAPPPIGAAIGGGICKAVFGYGLKKGHTEKFYDKDGLVKRVNNAPKILYYTSKNGESDIKAIQDHMLNKSGVLNWCASLFAKNTDLTGQKIVLESKHAALEKQAQIKNTAISVEESSAKSKQLEVLNPCFYFKSPLPGAKSIREHDNFTWGLNS